MTSSPVPETIMDAPSGVPLTLRWEDGVLHLLDQRRLPHEVCWIQCTDADAVHRAIADLAVRGAPAIGIAAAWGLALAMQGHDDLPRDAWLEALVESAKVLATARPTAVNLRWALDRLTRHMTHAAISSGASAREILETEALAIHREDHAICRAIGEHGLALLPDGARVLTHCNAGSLAVSAWGTALSPMYRAHAAGRALKVYADETRPVLQGARLTAFELAAAGIDVTLITDNMAAHLMSLGKVDLVLVGTDRVTANGDVVNKIGTLGVAVLARHFDIPFWVACPSSTWDPHTERGTDVPIEQRGAEEVTHIGGQRVAAEGVGVFNPAFDVTPAELVTGIITERGLVHAPVGPALRAQLGDPAIR